MLGTMFGKTDGIRYTTVYWSKVEYDEEGENEQFRMIPNMAPDIA
jgi:hypothetical protein